MIGDSASGFGWGEKGKEVPTYHLVLSPGLEGPEGPDRSHPVCGGGRGGVDRGRAVPGVGKSSEWAGLGLFLNLGSVPQAARKRVTRMGSLPPKGSVLAAFSGP